MDLTTFRSYLWYNITSGGKAVRHSCMLPIFLMCHKFGLSLFYGQLNIFAFSLVELKKKKCYFVFVF